MDPQSRPTGTHRVLPTVEGRAYASLSRRPMSREERYALGRALRRQVPRSSLGHSTPPEGRPDPVDQVLAANADRIPELIAVRIGRMMASPYAFLRGSAGIMAHDFAGLPATGITPVICGDAHLGNFGFYASPERDLVFDLNDFDEAHPGAWEWDVRRLIASVHVAGRQNGASEEECAEAVRRCVRSYREHLAYLAEQPLLERAYQRLTLDRLHRTAAGSGRKALENAAERARKRTSDRALPRFTEQDDSGLRLVEEPPLITRPDPEQYERIVAAL